MIVDNIDVVITYVDGTDPNHIKKRRKYSNALDTLSEDIGAETRFNSVGEINFCLRSILRYAQFVNKIYIVTDNQTPNLDDVFTGEYIGLRDKVEIIDHTVIFKGYEEYLPCFNSLSIETLLWRIPNLSRYYIYCNDDVFFLGNVELNDFFEDNKVICYASNFSQLFASLLRTIKPSKNGIKPFGFKDAILNSCQLINYKGSMPLTYHIPLAQDRLVLESFLNKNQDILRQNIQHRFRNSSQFNPQTLCYLLGLQNGSCVIKKCPYPILYLKPKHKRNYIDNKLSKFRSVVNPKFCCINSLDTAQIEDQKKVLSWLQSKIF